MIFTCTSNGSTLPNGLFLGSTNPRQSMMTVAKHGMGSLALFPFIHGFLGPIPTSRQDLGSHPKKVYPWGVPPRISSRPQTPPRDVSPPINASHQVCKSRCALRVSSFQFDQLSCSSWWVHSSQLSCSPCRLRFWSTCWRLCTTCPWATNYSVRYSVVVPTKNCGIGPRRSRGITRSPGNWTMKSIDAVWLVSFIVFLGVGPFFSLYHFWFFTEVFKGFEFLRTVLWPVHLCLCPRRARLNWAARFWVPACSCWFFLFVRFLGVHRESACVSHLPVGRPSHSWRSMQPLWAYDGWFTFRWYYFR